MTGRQFLRALFYLADHAPALLGQLRPLAVRGTLRFSEVVRNGVSANARRIFGSDLSREQCQAFARRVVGNFYDFVADVGRSSRMEVQQLRRRVEAVEGRDEYLKRRARGGGAIVVTAHMGSFELGLTALAQVEPRVHVVYKRDELPGFERLRQALRQKLGIQEAPIDDGWNTWIKLRDALRENHVVVMQGDRAMPGQKAQSVPMLGGHLSLPLGPAKLAQMTGAPIVPVFSVRTSGDRCRLFAEAPIESAQQPLHPGQPHPALIQIGKAIERFVAAYPDQWLVLEAAFDEDAPAAKRQVERRN